MGYNKEAYDAECWRQLREDRRFRNESRSSPAHRRPSGGRPRRSLARQKIRTPGKEAHRSAAESPAGYHHRDPVVPGAQESPREREGQRMGQTRGRGARHLWVEWLSYTDRPGARAMPLPRSLAHLKREITEKKWAEARQWAGGRTSKKKHKMPKSQRPDGAVASSSKRLASRFCQLKTGHCLSGQSLQRTKNRPPAQCWRCRCQKQTRDHLFKVCPGWKG